MTTYTDGWPLDGANLATPGWKPAGPLLTDVEAATYLRFDADDMGGRDAVESIRHLVEQDKLRPCKLGGRNRFSVKELDRFIDSQTDEASA